MDEYDAEIQHKGVKGWLLLLCISLTILDPATMLLNLFIMSDIAKSLFGTNKNLFYMIFINGIFTTGLMVFSIYAGLSLWRLTINAVMTAKRYLKSIFIYSAITILLPYIFGVSEIHYKKFGGNNWLNSIITMCYAMIWYIYLIKSKRVKWTYKHQ